ncbi:MarR family winged helix-turn-helix transcriptional regulator [Actinocatenispora sera]|uniref:HTH marR-type domain-containing protein n=1 Tax=Actinocatenispora sera TaxID=390989 RepID=A0A810KT61_9ACTN|nr:MarR family transcriptional regulator [Actinocatenispora sera]BCJ26134.1 hypothetical protein Asera_02420 [Actinocatenispora sera]
MPINPQPTPAGPVSAMVPRLARAHWLVAGELLQRVGLYPGQELLLMQLWEHDHRSQSELARALGLDPSTVARTVRSLEQQGLLTRAGSPSDRRARVVSLTRAGRDLRPAVEQVWADLETITTRDMTPRQRADAVRLMRRMEATLQAAHGD